ncbi:hypothetical protein [Streptomyces sp. NPDC087270]|uniref:hypothetical protein n=1 Tax=Streptomyces sp. NPDC087270 TaxID=3365774 RepID=UPI003806C041
MSGLTFELEPFRNEAQEGFRGVAGPYGDTMAYYVKSVRDHQPNATLRAQLVSEHLPEAHVDGIGMGGQPSPYKATLEVDGITGKLKYNSYGLTRAARALHITYADRTYTYAYTRTLRTDTELRRRGARITLTNGRRIRGTGQVRKVTTHGDTDEVDLAIALVFEAVATDPLDPTAAPLYGLFRSDTNGDG